MDDINVLFDFNMFSFIVTVTVIDGINTLNKTNCVSTKEVNFNMCIYLQSVNRRGTFSGKEPKYVPRRGLQGP